MQQMGGMSGLMAMMPGVAKIKNQLAERNLDEKLLKRQMAIIDSMTPQERRNPDMLKASRKRRIAAGSGTKPEDINKLLKMHRTMADMMKAMGGAKRGPIAGLANMLGLRRRHAERRSRWRSSRKKCRAALAAGNAGRIAAAGLPSLPPNFPATFPGLARPAASWIAGSRPRRNDSERLLRQRVGKNEAEPRISIPIAPPNRKGN